MSRRLILASLLAACLPLVMAAARASDARAAAGIYDSQVQIDSQGRVVQVTPDAKTPQKLQPAIDAALKALQFAPPMRDGHAASGTTSVAVRACSAETADAAPTFCYAGHGPRWLTPSTPDYPSKAAQGSYEGHLRVQVAIRPDGHGEYVDMEAIVGGAPAKRAFRRAVVDWAAEQRFVPETLDGQPQPGVRYIPTIFSLGRLAPTAGPAQSDRPAPDSLFTLVARP
jgi:hypothetical protein